ncbi:hypothetical protein LJC11_03635 [Bacteroidales bacterium OttesenSCG-928-I21]|nr:hypothetical protein [Bacteroidales bacterium OttesenSCG-928-I21]
MQTVSTPHKKNPFADYGYDHSIMTGSAEDLFEEFFDLEDTVELSSVYFNIRTKEIVGFIAEEKLKTEFDVDLIALSVDPHCDRYWWITPYAYCANNPVMLVDPDGRNYDDYEVNYKTGEITFLKKTEESTHRLVAQNKNGEIEYKKNGMYKNSKTVDKGVIDNMTINGSERRLDFGSGKDTKKQAIGVYNFLSDNTSVEWGAVGYNLGNDNMNTVGTSGSSEYEGTVSRIAFDNSSNGNLNYYLHSHSGRNSSIFPSRGRHGEGGDDVGFWQELWKGSPNAIMGIRYWNSTQLYEENKNNGKGYSPITIRK